MQIPDTLTALARLADVDDLDERYRILTAAGEAIPALQRAVSDERAATVQAMKAEPGATWEKVGARIGLHFARASQIARGVSGGVKRRPAGEQ